MITEFTTSMWFLQVHWAVKMVFTSFLLLGKENMFRRESRLSTLEMLFLKQNKAKI